MSGSGASNLGYGNTYPLSNINGRYANVDSSNWSGSFGSNQVPGLPGLAGAKSNIDAAAGNVPGICLFKGGAKLKRKIKNITKQYKGMKAGSRRVKRFKKSIRSRLSRTLSGGRRKRTHRRSRRQRGGYGQFDNNKPFSTSFATGGVLSPSLSMLANPVPISSVTNNAIDNYNHYTNMGFPSKGH